MGKMTGPHPPCYVELPAFIQVLEKLSGIVRYVVEKVAATMIIGILKLTKASDHALSFDRGLSRFLSYRRDQRLYILCGHMRRHSSSARHDQA